MLLRDVPLRILLVGGFLLSGLVPLMAVAILSRSAAERELHEQAFRQLESVRDIKKSQLVRFFDTRVAEIESLASDPGVADALAALEAATPESGAGLAGHGDGRFDAPAAYLAVHDGVFPRFATYVGKLGYYDLFLMDAARGFTFFTVEKEADFGVAVGESAGSQLERVWRIAASEGRAAVSDTQPYPPSGSAPAQFIAAPVRRGGRTVGVVAAQISLTSIDAFITERPGMGETGEVYLVGTDYRMRSDSFLDPEGHSVNASFRGSVEKNGVSTEASRRALAGETGSLEISDYRGMRVLSAFAPIDIRGTRWAIIAEIDAREIDAKISAALDAKITLILVLSLALLLLLALSIAAFVSRGVRRVIGELGVLIDGVLKGDLAARGDPDEVAHDFRGVVDKTNDLVRAFSEQTAESHRLAEVVEVNQRMESVGTLAGGIAHDFNNILSYLYNYGDLVLARLDEGSPERAHMVELLGGIDRASALVERLMAFGRQAKREKRVVAVAPLFREAAKLLAATIPRNIEIVNRVDDESLAVFADPTQLHQIVMNLCTNAFHSMLGPGGTMTLFAHESVEDGSTPGVAAGRYCAMTVADTGCGIPEEIRGRIFDPFFTTKPQGQGTGMGLAVVHGIVKSCSGAIVVDSRVGEGSTFRVYLPLCASPSPEGAAARVLSESTSFHGRILIVDDEAEILASTRASLESMGFDVRTAADGREAEQVVASAPGDLDLVLADVNMPSMGGVELLSRLKRARPDLPVVMMTGYSELMTDAEARALGAERIVPKPFRPASLARIIADILGDRRDAGT